MVKHNEPYVRVNQAMIPEEYARRIGENYLTTRALQIHHVELGVLYNRQREILFRLTNGYYYPAEWLIFSTGSADNTKVYSMEEVW